MVADRLVTVNGRSVDPDFDKVAIAQNETLRMAAGFTGIAYGARSVTGYGFHFVMTETLQRAICAGRSAAEVLEAFRADLEHQFARYRFRLADRGIEVLCAGFDYSSGQATPFIARVGNGVAGPVAAAFTLDLRTDAPAVAVAGFTPAVRPQDLAKVEAAAAKGRPESEVAGLALSVLSHAARHSEGRRYIGREYNLISFAADPNAPADSTFCARGTKVSKHPSFVTPTGIGYQTLITIPVDPRDHRRRTSDFRAALQFSPRACPKGSAADRARALAERMALSARETVQRFLVEHHDTVPPEVQPKEVITASSRSWRHVALPSEEARLRDVMQLVLGMQACQHRVLGSACVEAQRFVDGVRCVECAEWSINYMASCSACGARVCTNLGCPELFGDPGHTLDPNNGDVRHMRRP
jgi:hypothetical protein